MMLFFLLILFGCLYSFFSRMGASAYVLLLKASMAVYNNLGLACLGSWVSHFDGHCISGCYLLGY